MLDAVTLDQLRMFLAVVDEGSFSAAARLLRRVQSAVSHGVANMETQLGVQVFDRSTRVPTLTEGGRVLLNSARRVCAEADDLRRVAEGMTAGLEATVGLCVDAVFPINALVDLCREFAAQYPTVPLRVHTETLSEVAARVRDGTCHLGVAGPAADTTGLDLQHVTSVVMIPVAGSNHPLAKSPKRIPSARLAEHTQIFLSERGEGRTPDQGGLSCQTWRVSDLPTKREMLLAGLGWGSMPEHMVREDMTAGRLVRLYPAAWNAEGIRLDLAVVHRPDAPPGPATRWVQARLVELCRRDTETAAPAVATLPGPPSSSPRRRRVTTA